MRLVPFSLDFKPLMPIWCFPQEVQTAGAGFKEYWPELLEHVVWIHRPHVLKLAGGISSSEQVRTEQPLAHLGVRRDEPQGMGHG